MARPQSVPDFIEVSWESATQDLLDIATRPKSDAQISIESCARAQALLEWAGMKLLSMRIKSPKPGSAASGWPDYIRDPHEAFGYSDLSMRPAAPQAQEIPIMDEILLWPTLVPSVPIRRVIQARILVSPYNGRHLYSFARIAQLLHANRKSVALWYAKGMVEITRRLGAGTIDAAWGRVFDEESTPNVPYPAHSSTLPPDSPKIFTNPHNMG